MIASFWKRSRLRSFFLSLPDDFPDGFFWEFVINHQTHDRRLTLISPYTLLFQMVVYYLSSCFTIIMTTCIIFVILILLLQTEERLYDALLPKTGQVPSGWLLLEKEERRKDNSRGSHEIESSGDRMYLWMLRSFGNPPHISSSLLLVVAGKKNNANHTVNGLPQGILGYSGAGNEKIWQTEGRKSEGEKEERQIL